MTDATKVVTIDTRYTQDVIPILDTSKFEHMQRVASVMAKCKYVPDALTKNPESAVANCFLIVNHAVRWGMDPFALAQSTYELKGKIGFDGKAIAAAINSDPRLKGRLNYEFSGEGQSRTITVSGTFRDTNETKIITGSVANWKTTNGQWTSDPDQMLVYRGSRQWARRWLPDRLLGVYADDEIDQIMTRDVPVGHRAQRMKDITPEPTKVAVPSEVLDIPDPDAAPVTAAPAAEQSAPAAEADEENEDTVNARAAINAATSVDMLNAISKQFPEADWETLEQDYVDKRDQLE